MMLDIKALARRICEANHTLGMGGSTASQASLGGACGEHYVDASRYWGLVQPAGAKTLRALVDATRQQAIDEAVVPGRT